MPGREAEGNCELLSALALSTDTISPADTRRLHEESQLGDVRNSIQYENELLLTISLFGLWWKLRGLSASNNHTSRQLISEGRD
jgi:hypothetical protein